MSAPSTLAEIVKDIENDDTWNNMCRFYHRLPSLQSYQSFSHFQVFRLLSTGCPTKNYTLFWRAVASLNFELGIKVGGVLESSGSQLFKTVSTFDF